MNEKEKEIYCIKFIYRILSDKRVFNRFSCTYFGNIEENKTVRLNDCIDYIVDKYKELDVKED